MAVTFDVQELSYLNLAKLKFSDSHENISGSTLPNTVSSGWVYLFFTNSTSSELDPADQIIGWVKSSYHSENYYMRSGVCVSPYWYNEYYEKAAIHSLLNFPKQALSSADHNYLCKKYKNGFSAWLILLPYDGPVSRDKNACVAHCSGLTATEVLGYLKREYSCSYTRQNQNGSYNFSSSLHPAVKDCIERSISESFSDQTSFFLGAGYVETRPTSVTINDVKYDFNQQYFITDGSYIGLLQRDDGFCSISPLCKSLSDISAYSEKYQLVDGITYHYISASSSSLSGGESSDSGSSDSPTTYSPLDATTTAASNPQKYISDFSDWNLCFIPNSSFNGTYTVKNNNVLEIQSNNVGGQVLYDEIVEPKMKLTSYDIDQSELFELLDSVMDFLTYKLTISNGISALTLQQYFNLSIESRTDYSFIYISPDGSQLDIDFQTYLNIIKYQLINNGFDLNVELGLKQNKNTLNLYSLELFEAYTRGHDFIQETYTIVRPEERDPDDDSETSRIMSYDDNYFVYKYTGRNIDIFAGEGRESGYSFEHDNGNIYYALIHSCDLLQEADVTLGDTYSEQDYFIEAAVAPQLDDNGDKTGTYYYKDTFKIIDYLDPDNGLYDPTQYTDNDIEVHTAHIDLTQCDYYHPLEATYENNWCDCAAHSSDGTATVECIYQKLGYCPYRFESEKHPRRIRTLQESQSNRFNLIQNLCKTFEFYPYFYIEHEKNGRAELDENGAMKKHIFFATEKGTNKYAGFRYEKNLNSMSRILDSSNITTKLYVESVDSDYSNTGLCTIQTATDNISRTSYILDFSYYSQIGMLDAEQVQRDLYGINVGDFAFLPRIGEYNKIYDDYSNLIITMTGETLIDLEAEINVAVTGITTALEERQNVSQSMYQYKVTSTQIVDGLKVTYSYTTSDTYKNYVQKYREQAVILWGNIELLFFSNNYFSYPVYDVETELYSFPVLNYESAANASITGLSEDDYNTYSQQYCKGEFFWRLILEGFGEDSSYVPPFNSWEDFKEKIVDTKLYEINGKMGEYKNLYNEVKYWKCERAKILNKINDLSEQFYQRYEPYIKEGTFSDSDYLDDNEYYWAGVQVLNDSCKPDITYNFNVVDLSPLKVFSDDYEFDLGDTTYIEDIDFFGINSHTGFPNREKVIISKISYNLDEPKSNSITVQNYTSQFEDLFEQITASVQSLSFNENIYKRASNFTAQQYITTDSLQSTLDIGDLTLLDTSEQSITLDDNGMEGNDIENSASQYDIRGDGIYFSTDGGETWDYGVGAEGINMDYAHFGQLDTSQVQIVDGDYIYFLWDKDGINAYRSPATSTNGLVDFARFNRYGLSLIEDNNIRLRAGYEFLSNNSTGNYLSEKELTSQNIGFYLYNDNGQPIFKTETRSLYSEDDSDYTARLSLNGEIFVTNQVLLSNQDVVPISNYILSDQYIFSTQYQYSLYQSDDSYASVIYDAYNANNGYIIYFLNDDGDISSWTPGITFSGTGSDHYWDASTLYVVKVESIGNDSYACLVTTYEVTYISAGTYTGISAQDFFNDQYLDIEIEGTITSSQQLISLTDRGYRSSRSTVYYLDSEESNNTVNSKSYDEISITYYLSSSSSETKTDVFYATVANGRTSYWKEVNSDVSTCIENNGNSNTGVGIYINNKKSVHSEDYDYEDKTLAYQLTDDGDNHKEVILSGAERQFLIASSVESANSTTYNNVLSVLKNGVLYLGGTIYNEDGTSLNISGLNYMPDEIKINSPRLILSSNGYIYCQWDKFFNLIVNDDGTIDFGSNSLLDIVKDIQNGIADAQGNNSGITTSGCYFDEDEIDSGIK